MTTLRNLKSTCSDTVSMYDPVYSEPSCKQAPYGPQLPATSGFILRQTITICVNLMKYSHTFNSYLKVTGMLDKSIRIWQPICSYMLKVHTTGMIAPSFFQQQYYLPTCVSVLFRFFLPKIISSFNCYSCTFLDDLRIKTIDMCNGRSTMANNLSHQMKSVCTAFYDIPPVPLLHLCLDIPESPGYLLDMCYFQ